MKTLVLALGLSLLAVGPALAQQSTLHLSMSAWSGCGAAHDTQSLAAAPQGQPPLLGLAGRAV